MDCLGGTAETVLGLGVQTCWGSPSRPARVPGLFSSVLSSMGVGSINSGTCRHLWPLERVPAVPSFGRGSRVSKWISFTCSVAAFKLLFCFCASGQVSPLGTLSDIPPYCRFLYLGCGLCCYLVCYCSLCGSSVVCCVEAIQSTLTFSGGMVLYIGVNLLCPWDSSHKVSSESSYATTLDCLHLLLL